MDNCRNLKSISYRVSKTLLPRLDFGCEKHPIDLYTEHTYAYKYSKSYVFLKTESFYSPFTQFFRVKQFRELKIAKNLCISRCRHKLEWNINQENIVKNRRKIRVNI